MKVIYGLNRIKKYNKPVVALGVFDGLHKAHRRILKETVKFARKIKGTSIALTFWPHPQRQESLYSLEHRLRLIREIGIDICIVINFNKRFSKISAEGFVRNILVKKIGVHYLYVGRNFRFGKKAKGNFSTLNKLSHPYRFKVKIFDVIKIKHRPISSTYIRRLITQGDLDAAKRLLNRPVSVYGEVIKGISLAKRMGFPTANIDPHHEILPPSGVYAVRVTLNNKKFQGTCYIGKKPTFLRQKAASVEVYIFNFNKNIYGKNLEIHFLTKIRKEKKFKSAQLLAEQIRKDINSAKREFSRH